MIICTGKNEKCRNLPNKQLHNLKMFTVFLIHAKFLLTNKHSSSRIHQVQLSDNSDVCQHNSTNLPAGKVYSRFDIQPGIQAHESLHKTQLLLAANSAGDNNVSGMCQRDVTRTTVTMKHCSVNSKNNKLTPHDDNCQPGMSVTVLVFV